jgi:hypothetical protein
VHLQVEPSLQKKKNATPQKTYRNVFGDSDNEENAEEQEEASKPRKKSDMPEKVRPLTAAERKVLGQNNAGKTPQDHAKHSDPPDTDKINAELQWYRKHYAMQKTELDKCKKESKEKDEDMALKQNELEENQKKLEKNACVLDQLKTDYERVKANHQKKLDDNTKEYNDLMIFAEEQKMKIITLQNQVNNFRRNPEVKDITKELKKVVDRLTEEESAQPKADGDEEEEKEAQEEEDQDASEGAEDQTLAPLNIEVQKRLLRQMAEIIKTDRQSLPLTGHPMRQFFGWQKRDPPKLTTYVHPPLENSTGAEAGQFKKFIKVRSVFSLCFLPA